MRTQDTGKTRGQRKSCERGLIIRGDLVNDGLACIIVGNGEGVLAFLSIKERPHIRENIILELDGNILSSQAIAMILERVLIVLRGSFDKGVVLSR